MNMPHLGDQRVTRVNRHLVRGGWVFLLICILRFTTTAAPHTRGEGKGTAPTKRLPGALMAEDTAIRAFPTAPDRQPRSLPSSRRSQVKNARSRYRGVGEANYRSSQTASYNRPSSYGSRAQSSTHNAALDVNDKLASVASMQNRHSNRRNSGSGRGNRFRH